MGLGKFWNVQTEFDRENPMNNTESEGRIHNYSIVWPIHIAHSLIVQYRFTRFGWVGSGGG